MKRTYAKGWSDIVGDPTPEPGKLNQKAKPTGPEDIDAASIDWTQTRALSVRQPWAELIMLGEKDEEYRSGHTKVRGRIAIYASLSTENLPNAPDYGLDPDKLPRGVIIGTVELYDCDGGTWSLREPRRLSMLIKPTKHPQPVWFYPFGRD